ncbi:DUF4352 domain-containing protein [Streptosporangium sp. NPDC049304]|uniref:DUF4352 domain-containing protein n=1 Tax=Streptosporangium sp. NPDC049304 TaxID=3154830 RepID=UPI0034146A3A
MSHPPESGAHHQTHPGHHPSPGYSPHHHPGPPPKKKGGALKWLLIIGALLLLPVGCVALLAGAGSDQAGTTSATPEKPGAAGGARQDTPPGIGDLVKDGKFAFKITKTEKRTTIGGEFLNKKAQGEFLLVHVTVKNIGDEAQAFTGGAQKLYDDRGREFEADDGAAIYLEDSKSLYEDINPGNSVKGIVLFDLAKSVKPVYVELHDSVFSDGVKVELK